MKRYDAFIITLFVLTFTMASCDLLMDTGSRRQVFDIIEIPPADVSSVPTDVQDLYQWDAAQLTFRHIFDNELPERFIVELPEHMIRSFFNALVHVYHADHIAERDTVIEEFTIRARPDRMLDQIIVGHDGSESWAQKWKDGHRFTGYEPIDRLIEKYDLYIKKYYSHDEMTNWALLYTNNPLNTIALSEKFASIEEVAWAEPNGIIGDGNDIRAKAFSDKIQLDYSVGWGDCPAGCIYRRTWSFTVAKDGRVAFAGVSGPPLGSKDW
jgi:hypothetical protein